MKKNKMKFDNNTMIVIALVAVLLLWRHFGPQKVEEPKDEFGEGKKVIEEDEDKNTNPDLHVVVKIGSKGLAVKKCQERANTTILLVRNNMKKLQDAGVDQKILEYAMQISRLTGLKVDGVFGEKTKKVVHTLTGSNQTSLYTLRKKYANWQGIIDKTKKPESVTGNPYWF